MTEREQIQLAIAALEAQRAILGDAVVETALAPLREKLVSLSTPPPDQRKQVSVLFADMSGFTAMSETLDPEEVSDLMNQLWSRIDGVITSFGGLIDKHIGDAVMALFGAPTASEDDPERAVRAALAMHEAIAAYNQELGKRKLGSALGHKGQQQVQLRLRIGINTGEVLLGAVGTTSEYTAMGDAVNLASRLEHAAPIGGTLISHETYRQVRGIFDVQPLEPLRVKGKAEPVQVYVVERARPRAFRIPTRGVEGIETPTIGREAELQHLRTLYAESVAQQRPRLATIVGEAGIGKSRLVYEFQMWLDLLPEPFWLFQGRAGRETIRQPYGIVRDMIAFRFQISESNWATVACEKLEQNALSLLGADGIETAHLIGHLIGLDVSASPYLRGILDDARQLHIRARHALLSLLRAMAHQNPLVMLLEDMHWADDSSLELLSMLLASDTDLPLLVVATTRPSLFERQPDWDTVSAAHTRLALEPLSRIQTRRLVEEILRHAEDIPEALHELVASNAEGNPFYVEEVLKMLIDDGVIVKAPRRWTVTRERLDNLRVPSTLTGLLQARLDSLPAAERGLLQRAAVIGRVFWDEALERLETEGFSISDILARLKARELIVRRETTAFVGTQEFAFRHAMLHDVAYQSLLRRLRRDYHGLVAGWLVERSGERAAEYAGQIGEHFELAGTLPAAAEWYGRAGHQARMIYAADLAISFYTKALAFLVESGGDRAAQVTLHEGLGAMLFVQARYPEAAESYSAMAGVAAEQADLTAQSRAWRGLSEVQHWQGDYQAALESVSQAEALARAAASTSDLAGVLLLRGSNLYALAQGAEALPLCQEALALSTQLGDQNGMARCLRLLSGIYELLGQPEESARCDEQALALFRLLGNRMQEASVLNNMGSNALQRGDYKSAAAMFRQTLDVAQQFNIQSIKIISLTNLGGALVGSGAYAEAEPLLREALALSEAAGVKLALAYSACYLAEALLARAEPDMARVLVERALTIGRDDEVPAVVGVAWRTLGCVATQLPASSSVPTPDECFAESLRIFETIRADAERARTLRAWATYVQSCGDPVRSHTLLLEAHTIFEQLGLKQELERSV